MQPRRILLFGIWMLVIAPYAHSEGGKANKPTPPTVEVALLHINPSLNNLDENLATIERLTKEALSHGSKLIVAPELATTGYSITAQQVKADLGVARPFSKLTNLARLTTRYHAFLYVGVSEIDPSGRLYNSVLVFGPNGIIDVQRKRGIAMWNDRGDLPVDVLQTPYGAIATVICSDTYLPDLSRIAAIRGADVIVEPANWWGDYGQLDIWRARAREDNVWILVANRWGHETDLRLNPPITYDMNDAPSAVIDPAGNIRLVYRAKDSTTPANHILYYPLPITSHKSSPTLYERAPEAYVSIAQPCASITSTAPCASSLPPAGQTQVAVLAYRPSTDPSANLENLRQKLADQAPQILVLPALGLSAEPVPSDKALSDQEPWHTLQQLVTSRGILLLATSVKDSNGLDVLALFRTNGQPTLVPPIHDTPESKGSHDKPALLDLPNARVAVLAAQDFQYPEIQTEVALEGADIVLVISNLTAGASTSGWDESSVLRSWTVSADSGFHLAAADSTGYGLLIQNGGMFIARSVEVKLNQAQFISLDSAPARNRRLNVYYPFDSNALLSATN